MKKILLILLFSIGATITKAQNTSPDQVVSAMLKEFYTSYITTVSNDPPHVMETKIKSIQKRYCTESLLNKIPKLMELSDSDPFLKAQDSDTSILKTLTVKKDLKKSTEYIVSYSFDTIDNKPHIAKTTICLTVVNQKGVFKIDNVK